MPHNNLGDSAGAGSGRPASLLVASFSANPVANVGSTTLYTSPALGYYRISIFVTSADPMSAGSMNVDLAWTSQTGSQNHSTAQLGTNATDGDISDVRMIECTAGSTITFSTSGFGSGSFNLNILLENLA